MPALLRLLVFEPPNHLEKPRKRMLSLSPAPALSPRLGLDLGVGVTAQVPNRGHYQLATMDLMRR